MPGVYPLHSASRLMLDISKMDPADVVGKVFSGIGLLAFTILVLLWWQDQRAAQHSTKVTGTVSSLEYNSSGLAAPVIGYRHHGQKRYFIGTVWSSPPSFEVGEQVELLVNNDKPNEVIIDSFFERYFLICLLAFFATVFGAIGVLLLTLLKK